jgi:hypothetical protein
MNNNNAAASHNPPRQTMTQTKQRRKSTKENDSSSNSHTIQRSGAGRPKSNRHRFHSHRRRNDHPNRQGQLNDASHNGIARKDTNSTELSASESSSEPISLHWLDPTTHYVPLNEEQRLLPSLLHWGKSERGMMRDQPEFRLSKILKLIGSSVDRTRDGPHKQQQRHHEQVQINLLQSLSLRRHHLKLLNPKLSMPQLRLGSNMDIRTSADAFEQCLETHLRNSGVEFYNEADQRRMHRENGGI